MEFLFIFGIHFIIMGSGSMFLSLLVSSMAKKIPFLVTILGCMFLGVLYASKVGFTDILWLAALFNGVLSAVAVGLVKLGDYAGEKAERVKTDNKY